LSLVIEEVSPDRLCEYAEIPIAFEVKSILKVSVIDGGLGGIRLKEERIEPAYIKDYDSYEDDGPERWLKNFNLDNFGSAIATFKALNPRPGSNGFAIVLQTDQMKDLLEDIRSTTGVAFAGAAFEMNDMFSGMAGYHGVLEGYNVFESPSVIATDANNWSGFICGAGDRGSLGLAISRIGGSDLIVRMSEPGSSAHTKLQHEIFVGSEYGVGILQDNNFLEVVSKT